MRHLAVARYRLLTTVRTASWLFAVSFLAAAAPVIWKSGLFTWDLIAPGWQGSVAVLTDSDFMRGAAEELLAGAANAVVVAFQLHALILLVACDAFTSVRGAPGTVESHDLMDTTPIGPGVRYVGEALGIFEAAMIVHLATLPLLMLAGALSALPTAWIVAAEAAVVAMAALASAAGAWKLRSPRSKWQRTRSARSVALFLILLSVPVAVSTRWEEFRDALVVFAMYPSPRSWQAAAAAVERPVLLFVLLVLQIAGFLAFYYASSVRSQHSRRNSDAMQPLWT